MTSFMLGFKDQLEVVVFVQKKQSLHQPAKYAAVHEARTAEDRRTAAELTARLTKLRNDHKDSAAHVASELSQPPPSDDKQIEAGAVERVPKEKKPWPAKVCDVPISEGIRPNDCRIRLIDRLTRLLMSELVELASKLMVTVAN